MQEHVPLWGISNRKDKEFMTSLLESSEPPLLCRDVVDHVDKRQKIETQTKFVQTKNVREIEKLSKRNQGKWLDVSISFRY